MALNTASSAPLLRPVVGLAGWTFAMELWMYATRLPAIRKYDIKLTPYNTREDMNAKIPRPTQWIAENYNHLHEQPTVFYGVALTLALLGVRDRTSVRTAWAYVALRILHSLVQGLTNRVPIRFGVFATSSIALAGLTARAASLLF